MTAKKTIQIKPSHKGLLHKELGVPHGLKKADEITSERG